MRFSSPTLVFAALLCTSAGSGCELLDRFPPPSDPATAPAPQTAVKQLKLGKHLGFCEGYCYVDLSLARAGTGSVVYTTGGGAGAIGYDVALAGFETERLLGLAADAITQPWDERYGCPDCADQGAWPLEIETDRGTRRTTLDPHQVPAFLRPLTDALAGVIDRYPRAPQVTVCTEADRGVGNASASNVRVDRDELRFAVSFGGGCEPHAFRLCWDGSFDESNPVQARLRLIHETTPEHCEALLRRELAFDLRPLRAAHEAGYPGSTTRTILLSIDGQPGTGVRYQF